MSLSRTSKLLSQLDQHFGKCAVLAAAGVGAGMASAPQTAEAAIVYHPAANINVPSTTAGVYLNVALYPAAGSTGTAPVAGWDLNPWSSSGLSVWANNAAELQNGVIGGLGNSATLVDNLPAGTMIDGSSPGYVRTGAVETAGATAFALNSSDNLVGFRFFNEVAQCVQYGWFRMSLSGTLAAQPRAITELAYNDECGVGIAAGVPEPGSLALLAMGAAGMLIRRRK